jgi:hypothetical protein
MNPARKRAQATSRPPRNPWDCYGTGVNLDVPLEWVENTSYSFATVSQLHEIRSNRITRSRPRAEIRQSPGSDFGSTETLS